MADALLGFVMGLAVAAVVGFGFYCQGRNNGFIQGQQEAVQGKFYFQVYHTTDGEAQWVQVKAPTTMPVIK